MLVRRGAEVDVASSLAVARALLEHVVYSAAVLEVSSDDSLLATIAATNAPLLERTISLTTGYADTPRKIRKPFEIAVIDEAFGTTLLQAPVSAPSFDRDFTRTSILAGAKAGLAARLRVRSMGQLECVTSFGYPREVIEQWFPLAADAHVPICAAVRHCRPLFLASARSAGARYPLLAPILEENRSLALAAVPVQRGGRVIGVLGWSFAEPQRFDAGEQFALSGIADSLAEGL